MVKEPSTVGRSAQQRKTGGTHCLVQSKRTNQWLYIFAEDSIVDKYETGAYFGADTKNQFSSTSPFLVSSSM